jgi:hypothetical protein
VTEKVASAGGPQRRASGIASGPPADATVR